MRSSPDDVIDRVTGRTYWAPGDLAVRHRGGGALYLVLRVFPTGKGTTMELARRYVTTSTLINMWRIEDGPTLRRWDIHRVRQRALWD